MSDDRDATEYVHYLANEEWRDALREVLPGLPHYFGPDDAAEVIRSMVDRIRGLKELLRDVD